MEEFRSFLSALRAAHSMLERDRKGLYRSAATRPLHLTLKDIATRLILQFPATTDTGDGLPSTPFFVVLPFLSRR
jgi:hypothetical protein